MRKTIFGYDTEALLITTISAIITVAVIFYVKEVYIDPMLLECMNCSYNIMGV